MKFIMWIDKVQKRLKDLERAFQELEKRIAALEAKHAKNEND
jgi:uncharacterized coiled-coil protein SlyX